MARRLSKVTRRPAPSAVTVNSTPTCVPSGQGVKVNASRALVGPKRPSSTHRTGSSDCTVRSNGRTPGTTVTSVHDVPTAVKEPSDPGTTSATARKDDCHAGRLRGSAR